jgi:hypothetical protein
MHSLRALPAALVLALFATTAAPAAGIFTLKPITGDADSGISTAKTYTHAVDFGGGTLPDTSTTINGVPFFVGGPSGPDYSSSGLALTFGSVFPINSSPVGPNTLYDLFEDFYYSVPAGPPVDETLTLTGLTPGTPYVTTFYNVGFDASRTRVVTVSTSDGGSFTFDQNGAGAGNPTLLRYAFTASEPSMTYRFHPATSDPFHQYGFTNEVVPEPGAMVGLLGTLAPALRRRRGAPARKRR